MIQENVISKMDQSKVKPHAKKANYFTEDIYLSKERIATDITIHRKKIIRVKL